jgi:unsaturated rhamnogalacturonyl hydrolase
MSVLYSVACLVELDEKRGQSIFSTEERIRYLGWMEEWGEWAMHELPRTEQGGFQHSKCDAVFAESEQG